VNEAGDRLRGRSRPIEFAQRLADPDRMMAVTKKRVEAIEGKGGAKVVPIEKATKRSSAPARSRTWAPGLGNRRSIR
jgi:hypothetical protein